MNLVQQVEQLKTQVAHLLKKEEKPVDIKTVRLNIASGISSVQERITLPQGVKKRVELVLYGTEPTEDLEIAIKDGSGSEIVPSTHFKDWKHKGGGAWRGMKPVHFLHQDIRVDAISATNLAADFKAQLIIYTEI